MPAISKATARITNVDSTDDEMIGFFNSFEKFSLVYYCVCLVDYENGIPTYGKHVVSDYWNET